MRRQDLLEIIDSLRAAIDESISRGPSNDEKNELDRLAGKLDKARKELGHLIIHAHDPRYMELTGRLAEVNYQIKYDLGKMEAIRKILDWIKQAVGLIVKIQTLLGDEGIAGSSFADITEQNGG